MACDFYSCSHIVTLAPPGIVSVRLLVTRHQPHNTVSNQGVSRRVITLHAVASNTPEHVHAERHIWPINIKEFIIFGKISVTCI